MVKRKAKKATKRRATKARAKPKANPRKNMEEMHHFLHSHQAIEHAIAEVKRTGSTTLVFVDRELQVRPDTAPYYVTDDDFIPPSHDVLIATVSAVGWTAGNEPEVVYGGDVPYLGQGPVLPPR